MSDFFTLLVFSIASGAGVGQGGSGGSSVLVDLVALVVFVVFVLGSVESTPRR